ncbi:hypothetical protein CA11_13820 [Gimesia maris]|nr:hypothetical protein CA11_13820 [Gimesia maris]
MLELLQNVWQNRIKQTTGEQGRETKKPVSRIGPQH